MLDAAPCLRSSWRQAIHFFDGGRATCTNSRWRTADDTESAANAILQLVGDVRINRAARSNRSRDAARDIYDWDAYMGEWKDMLTS